MHPSMGRTYACLSCGHSCMFDHASPGIFVIVLVYNTGILHWIAYCTLGALICSAMINLINMKGNERICEALEGCSSFSQIYKG